MPLGHHVKHVLAQDGMVHLKLSVTEDGLTAETGLTIKLLLWNWHIFYYIDEKKIISHYLKL